MAMNMAKEHEVAKSHMRELERDVIHKCNRDKKA